MTRTAKNAALTDVQRAVLNAAAHSSNLVAWPLPRQLNLSPGSSAIVIRGLVQRGLIEQRPALSADPVWKEETASATRWSSPRPDTRPSDREGRGCCDGARTVRQERGSPGRGAAHDCARPVPRHEEPRCALPRHAACGRREGREPRPHQGSNVCGRRRTDGAWPTASRPSSAHARQSRSRTAEGTSAAATPHK